MILHDRVDGIIPGGPDPQGNPLPDVEVGVLPAHVRPIRSSESIARGVPPETAYYRLTLGRDVKGMSGTSRVRWRGVMYSIEGDLEPHSMLNGRTHHHEASLKRM